MRGSGPPTVLVWSDVVCPFCYIGKRRLEQALAQWPGGNGVRVVWKSFQLQPDVVSDPSKNSLQNLVERKGWTMESALAAAANLSERGRTAGLEFDFGSTKVANTFDAHRLAHFAASRGLADAMHERLFRAYFTEGRNIGDHGTLADLAAEAGLAATDAADVLASGRFADDVRRDIDEALQLGINGVPFFVFGGRYAVSGAQDVEVFLDVLGKAGG
jgi:predicted DsbA family dithiol-disulfide isomerase